MTPVEFAASFVEFPSVEAAHRIRDHSGPRFRFCPALGNHPQPESNYPDVNERWILIDDTTGRVYNVANRTRVFALAQEILEEDAAYRRLIEEENKEAVEPRLQIEYPNYDHPWLVLMTTRDHTPYLYRRSETGAYVAATIDDYRPYYVYRNGNLGLPAPSYWDGERWKRPGE